MPLNLSNDKKHALGVKILCSKLLGVFFLNQIFHILKINVVYGEFISLIKCSDQRSL